MKRIALALLAGLLLLGLAPALALASTFTVDQSNTGIDDFELNSAIDAQTFTAGMYGPLDSVELYLAVSSSATVSVSLEGTTGSPAVPSGPVLASKVLGVVATPGAWTRFNFSSPYVLNPGQVYSLVILPTDNASLFGTQADAYPRGRALTFNAGAWVTEPSAGPGGPADWAFKTEMGLAAATPTPTPAPTRAPTRAPTPAPTPTPTATATSAATPTENVTPTPTSAATDTATVAGATDAAAAPPGTGTGSGAGSSGSSDMTVPILAAIILVLLVVAGGLGFMLLRRRPSAPAQP